MIKNKAQLIKLINIICLSLLFITQSCSSNDFTYAETVIKKIEQYKQSHATLPNSLEDIGIENNSGPVFYDKLNDPHYQMINKSQSGNISVYNSMDKKWRNCPECANLFVNN